MRTIAVISKPQKPDLAPILHDLVLWMQARGLSGVEGAERMIVAYADLIDRLADLWRFPMLKLAARPESYQARTDTLTKWAMARAT